MRTVLALALSIVASVFGYADTLPEGAPGELLFPNSDFELGTLDHWRADGTAFAHQPTKGDNVKARVEERSANHEGSFWVGTYEKYQGKKGQKPGASQGNSPIGGLLSQGFIVKGPFITFLVGGGKDDRTAAQLIVRGEIVRRASGNDSPAMSRVIWDVREFLNEKAMIHLVDESKKPYGILNADDFRYFESGEKRLLFPNSDFEACSLDGWKGEGSAFEDQPVKGDNVTVRTKGARHANQQGLCWVGSFDLFSGKPDQKPGGSRGDAATGILRSQTFTIDGEKILFRIGGGNARNVGVRLIVAGDAVRVSRGQRQPEMTTAMWDVAPWKGQDAHIEIFDENTDIWGFVNADDFRYGGLDAALPVVPGKPMETMTLPESLHNTEDQPATPEVNTPAEAMPEESAAPVEPPVTETSEEVAPTEAPVEEAPEAAESMPEATANESEDASLESTTDPVVESTEETPEADAAPANLFAPKDNS